MNSAVSREKLRPPAIKVQQLKDQIRQLEQSIKQARSVVTSSQHKRARSLQEQRRGEEIKQSHAEKASTATQELSSP